MICVTLRLCRPAFLVGALCLTLAACGKGDRKKCEESCRSYATITFREVEVHKPEHRGLSPEQFEAVLAKKLTDGLEFCVSKCQAANNDAQSDCRIAARRLSELKACD